METQNHDDVSVLIMRGEQHCNAEESGQTCIYYSPINQSTIHITDKSFFSLWPVEAVDGADLRVPKALGSGIDYNILSKAQRGGARSAQSLTTTAWSLSQSSMNRQLIVINSYCYSTTATNKRKTSTTGVWGGVEFSKQGRVISESKRRGQEVIISYRLCITVHCSQLNEEVQMSNFLHG